MPATPVQLPPACNPEGETDKFLARHKAKVAKGFSFTRMGSLEETTELAYWLYVYRKDNEAMEIGRLIDGAVFSGNFNLWSPIERNLALYARLLGAAGQAGEAARVVAKMQAAGFVDTRLSGSLLSDREIAEAVADGDKTGERDWRLSQVGELCFMLALGGSHKYPSGKIETMVEEQLAALRKIQKIA